MLPELAANILMLLSLMAVLIMALALTIHKDVCNERLHELNRLHAIITNYTDATEEVTARMAELEARNGYLERRKRVLLCRWWHKRRARNYLAAWALRGMEGR